MSNFHDFRYEGYDYYNHMPMACRGSKEIMKAWHEKGGDPTQTQK